jgi:regulator of RNase E activity RraA
MSGVVSGLLQLSGNSRIAGRVVTVKLGTGEPMTPPKHLGCTAIEQGNVQNVIVLEQRTGIEAACWGGLLSVGACKRGIAGVIADGLVRDIDEARALKLPIFARAVTPRTARGRIVEKGTNVPIVVGAIAVAPGDYVIADGTGVVFIRAADISTVLQAAEEIASREKAMAQAIDAGRAIGQVMGGDYEDMLQARK